MEDVTDDDPFADPIEEGTDELVDSDMFGDDSEPDDHDDEYFLRDENRRWHGWSDYENVSIDLRKQTNRALKAYSHLQACHTQNMGITPQTAANAKGALMTIVKRLRYEVKKNAALEEFSSIHERWEGVRIEEREGKKVAVNIEDEPGYVSLLERINFTREFPDWMNQLMDDVIVAGWELGYIKAGKEKPAKPESTEEQIEGLFE